MVFDRLIVGQVMGYYADDDQRAQQIHKIGMPLGGFLTA
jgi:hypothetical protein